MRKLIKKIGRKRTQFARHCFRRTNEQTSKFIILKPNQEKPLRGRPSKNFVDVPENDTGLKTPQIKKNHHEASESVQLLLTQELYRF